MLVDDDEDEEYSSFSKRPIIKKKQFLSNSASLRNISDMEDYLKEKHGEGYTD
jgi:hypothetical protein